MEKGEKRRDKMKIHFDAVTPAQINFQKNIMSALRSRGHTVILTIRPNKYTELLLKNLNINHKLIGIHKKSKIKKIIGAFSNVIHLSRNMKHEKYDLSFGSIYSVYASSFLRIPSIIFEDDEVTKIQQFFYVPLANTIITPYKFRTSFGKKHIRMMGYKELAYLHPKYFKPDREILDYLQISKDEKYIIIRWNTWDAIHDVGKRGFDVDYILKAIKKMENYATVFISTERDIPRSLQKYKIKIPFDKIHHALYYAQLLLSDTQTMSTEAAILGTPTIRCNSFVGPNDDSNYIELEKKYKLMFNFRNSVSAINKTIELINEPNIKGIWLSLIHI